MFKKHYYARHHEEKLFHKVSGGNLQSTIKRHDRRQNQAKKKDPLRNLPPELEQSLILAIEDKNTSTE